MAERFIFFPLVCLLAALLMYPTGMLFGWEYAPAVMMGLLFVAIVSMMVAAIVGLWRGNI